MSRAVAILGLLVCAAPAFAQVTTPTPAPKAKLTKEDVVRLHHGGVSDDQIIALVRASGTVFHLEVADMIALKQMGISDRVLEAMVNTEMGEGRPAAVSPSTGEAARDAFDHAESYYRQRRWPEASDALFAVSQRTDLADADLAQARLHLGESLEAMGLPACALLFYGDVLQDGPDVPSFAPALTHVLELSEAVHDRAGLLQRLRDLQPARLPEGLRHDVAFFYAQVLIRQDRLDDALTVLADVADGSPYHWRARYVAGVVHALRDENDDAIALFREIAAACASSSKPDGGDLCDRSKVALGETSFQAGRLDDALAAFDGVPSGSPYRADALHGKAWTLYRLGRYDESNQAVYALHAQEFDTDYRPEMMVVEIEDYYRLGLDREAMDAINRFFARYGQYFRKIDSFGKQAAARPPEQVYAFLQDFFTRPKGKVASFMPYDLMMTVARTPQVNEVRMQVEALEADRERIRSLAPWRGTDVAHFCNDLLTSRKEALQKLGGKLIQLAFDDRYRELDDYFAQMKSMRADLSLRALRAPEPPSSGHEALPRDGEIQVRFPTDEIEWPIDGDSWKDAPLADSPLPD